MTETMLLVPMRTAKQGVALNQGKLKDAYKKETSTVEIKQEDMDRLGLKTGDRVRLRAGTEEVIVSCKPRKVGKKVQDTATGIIFLPYGPVSSALMTDGDTAGTGMPDSKHLIVEIEGPLAQEESDG
jgi:formylmethanofuran dehydrogenase subunit D